VVTPDDKDSNAIFRHMFLQMQSLDHPDSNVVLMAIVIQTNNFVWIQIYHTPDYQVHL
jgi:hypothetical protein